MVNVRFCLCFFDLGRIELIVKVVDVLQMVIDLLFRNLNRCDFLNYGVIIKDSKMVIVIVVVIYVIVF